MKHKNNHNLNQDDIVICIRSRDAVYGSYFVEGRKYKVMVDGLNQTDNHEIFLQDIEFNQAIKYVTDSKFKKYFELDVKETRKRKLDKINEN